MSFTRTNITDRDSEKSKKRKSSAILFLFVIIFFFYNVLTPLSATPDNSEILFANYPNNEKAMDLRRFSQGARRIVIQIDLDKLVGISSEQKKEIKESILEAFEKGSYFRFIEVRNTAHSKQRTSRRDEDKKRQIETEKILMKITLDRKESKRNEGELAEIGVFIELTRRDASGKRFVSHSPFSANPKEIKNFIIEWKKDFFPSEESFTIGEFFCYDSDKFINALLVRACSDLLNHTQNPGRAKFFLDKANKKVGSKRSSESIQNLLGYHFVSIGDFKSAEECFLKAKSLDEDVDQNKYDSTIQKVRELRNQYFYYETRP
ncbi:hypothetical protein HGB47_03155 [Leptospira yasudae]|uniref:hypothetical protein n=1 Tax=Leptospira yasudae TaxID=2202201 RepID=UPI001C4E4A8A|nr:hypothetical protein [Leptospira yasudae]MBW0432607.1 hypothetical protein [Leptospira yasudae]